MNYNKNNLIDECLQRYYKTFSCTLDTADYVPDKYNRKILAYIFKNMNLFDMSPFKEKNDAFKRLLDVANLNAMTSHERAVYDENLKIYRDWRNTLEYAVEEAEMKGMTKGKAEGKVEEQRQIAANLKKQEVNIETIAQCTGLSVEEIDKL